MQVRRAGTGLGGKGLGLLVRAGGAQEERASQPGQAGERRSRRRPSEWELEQRSRGRAAYPTAHPAFSEHQPTQGQVLGDKAGLWRGSGPTDCVAQSPSAAAHSGPSLSCPYSARVTFSALVLRTPVQRPWLSVSGCPN